MGAVPDGAVLVTGAAGGLGTALVDALLERGRAVVALDRHRCERSGVTEYVVDLRDEHEVREAVDHAAGLVPLNHLVTIAGGALPEEKRAEDAARVATPIFRASVEQNLVTAWIALRAVLPHLRRADGDRSVVLTSSTDALASYGLPGYAAAKAGLIGLVHALTGALGADGIRINALAPGDVPTPRNVAEWAHRADWYERLAKSSALGRLATPADIAAGYLSLLDMAQVTGQTLVVDGGQTMSRPSG
jgi:NAD(P)-dependent dehydrogenase (short-subunit alcohol dehydrogenase family)